MSCSQKEIQSPEHCLRLERWQGLPNRNGSCKSCHVGLVWNHEAYSAWAAFLQSCAAYAWLPEGAAWFGQACKEWKLAPNDALWTPTFYLCLFVCLCPYISPESPVFIARSSCAPCVLALFPMASCFFLHFSALLLIFLDSSWFSFDASFFVTCLFVACIFDFWDFCLILKLAFCFSTYLPLLVLCLGPLGKTYCT